MKNIVWTSVILLLLQLPGTAQTTTRSLEWDYLDVTPAIVATWTQTVKVNNVVLALQPTCTAAGVNTHCVIPLLTTLNATTNNVLSVTAADANESFEAIYNYNPSTPDVSSPKLPANTTLKIKVVVIVK